MTVEQIAIRQEVRQLLSDAGFNKNTMKDVVREVINEELTKAVRQVMHEFNLEEKIHNITKGTLEDAVRKELRASIDNRVNGIFNRLRINVSIDPAIK
jgi:F0F1-type ATP synthase delta subunit